MSIDLKYDGSYLVTKPGTTETWRYQINDYSVQEDATPIVGGDSSGGVSQFNVSVKEDPDNDGTALTFNRSLVLNDSVNGSIYGTINDLNTQDGVTRITAQGRLGAFIADRKVNPFSGTLEDAFKFYMQLANISAGDVIVDPSIASRNVSFPGFFGNIWAYMKELCVAQHVEIVQEDNNVALRPVARKTLTALYDVAETWNISKVGLAQSIEIYNYNTQAITDKIVYPSKDGWTPDAQVFTVEANETVEYEVNIDAFLTSVQQPECKNSVGLNYVSASVYTVTGNDGFIVKADQWKKEGGRLSVKIGPQGNTLIITIKGSGNKTLGPYFIGEGDSGDNYSTLRIVGTGVRYTKELITIPTGTPASQSVQEVGVTIDSPFITNIATAYRVGTRTAQKYAGSFGSLSITTPVAVPKDSGGNPVTQIGNIAGSVVKYRESFYRVKSASITPTVVTYTAERYNKFSDLNTANAAVATFTAYQAIWAPAAGKTRTFNDLTIEPLRNTT